MRKILSIFMLSLFLVGCHDHDEKKEVQKDITVLIYHPYVSGMISVLNSDFQDILTSVKENAGMQNVQLLRFTAPQPDKAFLIEISYDIKKQTFNNDTLQTYSFPETNYTNLEGLQKVFADIKTTKKAEKLGMITGGHANGWIPVNKVKRKAFGSGSDVAYKTNFTTLSDAILNNGLYLEFLVIDNCNSQNIENAYDLRYATKNIIASATEIMNEGMPYVQSFQYLINGDYVKFCDEFLNFYNSYDEPYATLSILKTDKMEQMAEIMLRINTQYQFDYEKTNDVQPLGGNSFYNPQFYDFKDYVEHLCDDEQLLQEFSRRLSELIPHYVNTESFFWAASTYPINKFCGVTCSDPCPTLQIQLQESAWYKATHPEVQ